MRLSNIDSFSIRLGNVAWIGVALMIVLLTPGCSKADPTSDPAPPRVGRRVKSAVTTYHSDSDTVADQQSSIEFSYNPIGTPRQVTVVTTQGNKHTYLYTYHPDRIVVSGSIWQANRTSNSEFRVTLNSNGHIAYINQDEKRYIIFQYVGRRLLERTDRYTTTRYVWTDDNLTQYHSSLGSGSIFYCSASNIEGCNIDMNYLLSPCEALYDPTCLSMFGYLGESSQRLIGQVDMVSVFSSTSTLSYSVGQEGLVSKVEMTSIDHNEKQITSTVQITYY